MAMDRRGLLLGLACSALPLPGFGMSPPASPAFLATGRRADGFHAMALDSGGRIVGSFPLPGRGHGMAVSPDGLQAVVFARRPGRFAVPFTPADMRAAPTFGTSADRHFLGHGFFSADGSRLFTTQNDFEAARGVLGIHDTRHGYRRAGEIETHGIGPHEALLTRDGTAAVIANGGILTHPDYPRRKLNIPDMQPSLARVELATGALLARATLPPALHRLSIRHLVQAPDGGVWFCCQHEGPAMEQPPLVGRWDGGDGMRLLDLPRAVTASFRNYAGSIAASHDGQLVAVSSPRGGVIVMLDGRSGAYLETIAVTDVCGLAPDSTGIAATSGTGIIRSGQQTVRHAEIAWDNHMTALAIPA